MDSNDSMTAAFLGSITFDEAAEFIAERVKNHVCPSCHTDEWSLVGDEEHLLVMVGVKKGEDFSLPPPGIPVFAINCKFCGHIKFHALAVISKWKMDRKNESSAN
jgi:hypothetical protein